jgi:ribosomal protein L37AE/L43A
MGRRVCPRCGSEDLMMVTGGITGMWECKKCGYANDTFPEREEMGKEEKSKK